MDWVTIVTNLGQDMQIDGPVWRLISAICYLLAVIFAIGAIFQLKDISEEKRGVTWLAPILTILAAVMLASAPESISMVYSTVYGPGAPTSLGYVAAGAGGLGFQAIVRIVMVIGYVFFVRGVVILKKAGEPQHAQNETVPNSLVFMLAGMCAIYIETTLRLVANVTGWNIGAWLA
jgi:hypothetical protein